MFQPQESSSLGHTTPSYFSSARQLLLRGLIRSPIVKAVDLMPAEEYFPESYQKSVIQAIKSLHIRSAGASIPTADIARSRKAKLYFPPIDFDNMRMMVQHALR